MLTIGGIVGGVLTGLASDYVKARVQRGGPRRTPVMPRYPGVIVPGVRARLAPWR